MRVRLEICVEDMAGVAAAIAGGADRLELCSALALGGLTPSPALIDRAVAGGLPVHVLVRPRPGGFVLDDAAAALVAADIREALARGAAGVVVGALTPDGRLDRDRLARFRDAARDGAAVLHRAVDLLADPADAVEPACALGYDGVLSSGGATQAMAGAATLARMVERARGRLAVIAGAGVAPGNVSALVAASGVRHVHGSAGGTVDEPDERLVRLGFAAPARRATSRAVVAELRRRLDGEEQA